MIWSYGDSALNFNATACIGKSAAFGGDSVFRSGAPRSMKMGNTHSPWRYDAEAFVAIQLVNLRWPAISRYALPAEISSISKHVPAPFEAWSTLGLSPAQTICI
jgi:hypothetical protein